jgi:hypothetical protein
MWAVPSNTTIEFVIIYLLTTIFSASYMVIISFKNIQYVSSINPTTMSSYNRNTVLIVAIVQYF